MTTVWLRALQGAEEIAAFQRTPDGTVLLERAASEPVRRDLQRWLDNGFTQLLGPFGNRQPQSTLPADPNLFDRIVEYLRRHGLDVRLDVEGDVPRAANIARQLPLAATRLITADAPNVGSTAWVSFSAPRAVPMSVEFGTR